MVEAPRIARRGCRVAPALAIILAACSTPPATLSNPRDSIVLQWQEGKTSDAEAARTAERHCDAWGTHAISGDRQRHGDSVTQTFLCR
jgi:hypothetical protein